MDLKETIIHFRAHWQWLADHPNLTKNDWPKWDFNEKPVENDCFLCEYVLKKYGHNYSGNGINCEKCPINWPVTCNKSGSLHSKWHGNDDTNIKSSLAKKISQLPLKRKYIKDDKTMQYKFSKKYENGFSVSNLHDVNACPTELQKFAFEAMRANYKFDELIEVIDNVLDFAKTDNNINWLIDHNFIEKIDNEITYHRGQKFIDRDYGHKAIIARDNNGDLILIDIDTGIPYCDPIKVKNENHITPKEFILLSGEDTELKPIE
jgi:hypothetical protein